MKRSALSDALCLLLVGVLVVQFSVGSAFAVDETKPVADVTCPVSAGEGAGEAKLDPKLLLETALPDPVVASLENGVNLQEICEAAKACKPGEKPTTVFRVLLHFVLRSFTEFKESVLAIRGRTLRSRPIALFDFLKNLCIAWVGQLYGAMVLNGDFKGLLNTDYVDALGHLTPVQLGIAWNTLFMIWTQSERGAATTKDVPLPKLKSLNELWSVMRGAYRGANGFTKEAGDRLVGTLALVPVEIINLSLVSVVIAIAHSLTGSPGPDLGSAEHATMLQNFATFAVAFGTYLSFKWAFVSKVFDLRVLPMLRGWASRPWKELAEAMGVRRTETTSDGKERVRDKVTFLRLITIDAYKAIVGKRFECTMDGACQFTDEPVPEAEQGSWTQYWRRWAGYLNFQSAVPISSRILYTFGFPIEMVYRWGNSLLDGFFVMWLVADGAPAMRNWIASIFY